MVGQVHLCAETRKLDLEVDLYATHFLYAERKGLRHSGSCRCGRKWCDRARLVEPDVFIELPGDAGLEVVTHEFGFGPVDNSDRALETQGHQLCTQLRLSGISKIEHKCFHAGVVA